MVISVADPLPCSPGETRPRNTGATSPRDCAPLRTTLSLQSLGVLETELGAALHGCAVVGMLAGELNDFECVHGVLRGDHSVSPGKPARVPACRGRPYAQPPDRTRALPPMSSVLLQQRSEHGVDGPGGRTWRGRCIVVELERGSFQFSLVRCGMV